MGKAYENYYTHNPANASGKASGDSRSEKKLRFILRGIYEGLVRATPIHYERKRLFLMYLDRAEPGRLLDVGCGDGKRLARLRGLGWRVEGQEVDPKSAEYARDKYGIPVHLGALEDLHFPGDTFDAITMNHVVEHVYDPVALLAECNRILKPGATLVVVTPNIESYGHKRFGSHWRGLEPPRHLHLFSQKTLREIASKAGFRKYSVWTTAANTQIVTMGSLNIRKCGRHEPGKQHRKLSHHALSLAHQLRATVVHMESKSTGEECVLKAIK